MLLFFIILFPCIIFFLLQSSSQTFSSIQSLSRVWLFASPWTAARQASLSITNSRSLHKLMSIELVMPPSHLIFCHPLLLPPSIFPAWGSFQMSQFFTSGGQSIAVSASASVLPMNIQAWFPLGWNCWISLLSKGLWTPQFSNTTVQMHHFFGAQLSLYSNSHIHMTTGKTIGFTRQVVFPYSSLERIHLQCRRPWFNSCIGKIH